MHLWILGLLHLLALRIGEFAPERWPKPAERIVCGPLTMEVYLSRTAHCFHLVDQLSAWDNACHGQYRAHATLSTEDEEILARYAAMRQKRRWGQGLEQTFYVPLELDEAIAVGIKKEWLRADEAEIARTALLHFSGRADELLEGRKDLLLAAFRSLDRKAFERAAKELSELLDVKQLTVPAFPLASPAPGGGGMDGGRLRWELCSAEDLSFSVLLHELTHAFFNERQADLEKLVAQTSGLSLTLLGEGLAYAMAPGLHPDGTTDTLAMNVSQDLAAGRGWGGTTYEHQRLFGLALRPLLREALDKDLKLQQLLPRVRDVFVALEEALTPRGPPTLFVGGPVGEVVKDKLRNSQYHLSMLAFNHDEGNYKEVLTRARRGDLLVLLFAQEDSERFPPSQAKLLPIALEELEAALSLGKRLSAEHVLDSGLRVVLLVGATLAELRAEIQLTALF